MPKIGFARKRFKEIEDKNIVIRVLNVFLRFLYFVSFGVWYLLDDCLYNSCSEELFWVVPVSVLSIVAFYLIKNYIIIPVIIYIVYGKLN